MRIEKGGVLHSGHYPLTNLFNGHTYNIVCKQGNDYDQNTIVSEEVIQNRTIGSTILVSAPAGSFGLTTAVNRHLFISGGIGITSFMAIIDELNQQGQASSISLIQCVRTESHAAFASTLEKIIPKGQYLILTQEEPIAKSHIEGKLQPGTHVYLSGSEAFLTMAENALAGFNHPRSQIHTKSIEPTLRVLKKHWSKVNDYIVGCD